MNLIPSVGQDVNPIKKAFIKVKNEFLRVRDWILFFNSQISSVKQDIFYLKRRDLEQRKFNERILTHMEDLSSKLSFLESRVDSLESSISDNSTFLTSLNNKVDSLSEIKSSLADLTVLLKNLNKTYEKDMSGHEKDMSGHEKDMSLNPGHVPGLNVLNNRIVNEPSLNVNIQSLTPSELYILRVLLNAHKPLTYAELSTRTGRKEKTIRNIIYSLRNKHVPVQDIVVSPKGKAFFVDESFEFLLSGR